MSIDTLEYLRRYRKHGKATLRRIRERGLESVDNGFDPYLNTKRRAIGRPVLHYLAQREADLRCVAAYRELLAA